MPLCLLSSMGSFCVIIVTLGVITLGYFTVVGTPGSGTMNITLGGAIFGTSLGNTLVWVFFGCIILNNFFNLSMACNWLSPIVKLVCGPVFLSTCISSLESVVACSVEDYSWHDEVLWQEFHHICMSFPPVVGCVSYVALLVLHSWSGVTPRYSMYPPIFCCCGFSCTITYIPDGTSGVFF